MAYTKHFCRKLGVWESIYFSLRTPDNSPWGNLPKLINILQGKKKSLILSCDVFNSIYKIHAEILLSVSKLHIFRDVVIANLMHGSAKMDILYLIHCEISRLFNQTWAELKCYYNESHCFLYCLYCASVGHSWRGECCFLTAPLSWAWITVSVEVCMFSLCLCGSLQVLRVSKFSHLQISGT